jgi:uncharacterized protein (DUF433 family)
MATLMEGHIEVDAGGTARVAGSRIKVIHLVMEKTANRWSAEELAAAFPHLTPAQVHAALAYYYDHQVTLDAQIQASVEYADRMRAAAGPSPVAERLRADGKLK